MSNNVIILGAGFSYNAGIPLLGGFVERMWEFAARKVHNGKALSDSDIEIFEDAIRVKNELDPYHGRAVFDDRNIEDILSILSFNMLGGGAGDRAKLSKINRAIARTIELTCAVTHPGLFLRGTTQAIDAGPKLYQSFWFNLFDWYSKSRDFPTIITFNYDLVLERALFQLLINTNYDNYKNKVPFQSFEINYHNDRVPELRYAVSDVNYNDANYKPRPGTTLARLIANPAPNHLAIEILKLHGSLNFPKPRAKTDAAYNVAASLEDPHILPPISNKMSTTTSDDMWRVALQRLREAKNVVIVGYSLPRTDIYMQYFLKAALGPNMDLNRISVFDPVLYTNSQENKEMRARYQDCFASQLHKRISFNLDGHPIGPPENYGTAAQFVQILGEAPNRILF